MIGRTIVELSVGQGAELARRIAWSDVSEFVDAVGDNNPLHSDPAFAAQTAFGEPIAPGVFTAGLISAVIGTQLPGPGTVYLSQSLKFIKAVRVGDLITARVEVLELLPERNRARLATVCRNQRGEDVLIGEAWVLPPRVGLSYERQPLRPVAVLQPWAWAAAALTFWSRLGLALLGGGASPAGTPTTSIGRR
jgi:acyl dehydratase